MIINVKLITCYCYSFLIALYMQSNNKSKLRLFAKHTVPKKAHKKPEKSPERAQTSGEVPNTDLQVF